jgi:CRP-like cAMP-binding protein/CheY-like chemotaxis protein
MDLAARPPTVLLAEPDFLIAEDLSDALMGAGYRVLGPFATTPEALAAIDLASPALAVVDVKLRDGFCTVLGRELRLRRIPILVHSGFQQDEPRASDFQNLPWLTKPALPNDIIALLDSLAKAPPPMSAEVVTPIRRLQPVEGRSNPFIRKLEGFVTLSQADREILERISANPRPIAPHTDFVRAGDPPDGVHLVMSGIACRYKQRSSGARQITAYLVPGDTCDLDVALMNRMDHTLATLSACEVVRIPVTVVKDLMEHHPAIARALRMASLVDEATLHEWLVNVGQRTALERIAHLFCELITRFQAAGVGTNQSCDLPVTQNQLADTTGMTTVHVNRSLQELRRRGLIELKGRTLRILDWPRLKRLAEFDADYLHLGERSAA